MNRQKYYEQRDKYYGVTGDDFHSPVSLDLTDIPDILKQVGNAADPSDIDSYQINEDGGLDYNRIQREAQTMGTLDRYQDARQVTGQITLSDGTQVTYAVPTQVTAYSAVPLTYTVVGGQNAGRVHVSATTWEEPQRAKGQTYYENTLPDDVNLSIEYLGYVQTDDIAGANPSWAANPKRDVQGSHFPGYTTGDVVCSGTVPTGKTTWLKFSATNTGNTILKGDGMGYFSISPLLYKKDENGVYQKVAMVDNKAVRLLDAWYPGETIAFYTRFAGANSSYTEGEYQVVMTGDLANEQDGPNWAVMYSTGRQVTKSVFSFTASDAAEVTKPQPVQTNVIGSIKRNGWLGTYEEFQNSFHTHLSVSTDGNAPNRQTIYFQPAPFDKTLTLRVISDATGDMKAVTLPLTVESDSLSIALNPFNTNYVITEKGTREPMLATQNMADMRGNFQESPYALETVVNDLKNMQEAGVNYLTSTMAFSYDLGTARMSINSFRFMMDCADLMGFAFEGYGAYPYHTAINRAALTRDYADVTAADGNNKVAGTLTKWLYERFGRMFWADAQGQTPIAQEDSRGWLTIDHDWRMDLDDDTVSGLQSFLQQAYGTIEKLNAAYGSDYTAFEEIDPREKGFYEENTGYYNFTKVGDLTNPYHERSDAVRQMDVYRTLQRLADYREVLAATGIDNAQMMVRYESSPIVAVGMNPYTKNPHYRETYYQTQRGGLVGEVLASSDQIYGTSTYQNTPYTASETYELTKHASLAGLTVLNYHMHYREQIYNTAYGDSKAVANLNLANKEMKVTSIKTGSALYPMLKATYEAGGIPAVMWMDYYCSGFITKTQYLEIRFYTQKIKEMLATEEGKDWATNFDVGGSTVNQNADHLFSYDPDYVQNLIDQTPRFNRFTAGKNGMNDFPL